MINLKNKNILILGAGKSGIAAARFLLKKNPSQIVLSDIKADSKLENEIFELEKKGVI